VGVAGRHAGLFPQQAHQRLEEALRAAYHLLGPSDLEPRGGSRRDDDGRRASGRRNRRHAHTIGHVRRQLRAIGNSLRARTRCRDEHRSRPCARVCHRHSSRGPQPAFRAASYAYRHALGKHRRRRRRMSTVRHETVGDAGRTRWRSRARSGCPRTSMSGRRLAFIRPSPSPSETPTPSSAASPESHSADNRSHPASDAPASSPTRAPKRPSTATSTSSPTPRPPPPASSRSSSRATHGRARGRD
jgi:hypothetical protein